jgi:putative transcriptional regulator
MLKTTLGGELKMSRVAELREKAGLTQRQLADSIGVTESTIRNLENNRNGINQLERFIKLCSILNCEPRDIIGYKSVEKAKFSSKPKSKEARSQ